LLNKTKTKNVGVPIRKQSQKKKKPAKYYQIKAMLFTVKKAFQKHADKNLALAEYIGVWWVDNKQVNHARLTWLVYIVIIEIAYSVSCLVCVGV